jgi:chain length determinant protein tyrosine kinase EpsG
MGHIDKDLSGPENVVAYMEQVRKVAGEKASVDKALLKAGTQWADRRLGEILVDNGKLDNNDIERIVKHQHKMNLYFGEAAIQLKLVEPDDILHALSIQFGYPCVKDGEVFSRELVMAHSPFGEQAETFRTIRSQILTRSMEAEQKTLAIVSPENQEGRSYIAANLSVAFSQLGHSTLLIDADMRSPRQHIIFNFTRRIGLSSMLTGRITAEDLESLPDSVPPFDNLSVLGCGAVPPNPAELLGRGTLPLMLKELVKYFDFIIIDTPPAKYQADVVSIASAAGNALLIAKRNYSKMAALKDLKSTLSQAGISVVGSVLDQF